MLTVELRLNGRLIGGAKVVNITDLAAVSDYHVEVVEEGSDVTGLDDYHETFHVRHHRRRQSVWALVEKVAHHASVSRAGSQPEDTETWGTGCAD